jgi:hypothetical protein
MSAFTTAITQFFAALTVLFSAFKSGASTINNLCIVAEESSGAYKDQARIERIAKLKALNDENKTNVLLTAE